MEVVQFDALYSLDHKVKVIQAELHVVVAIGILLQRRL